MKWWEMMSSKVEKQTQNLGERAKRMPGLTWERFVSVGREDPRRLIHAVKVGISLTLVSLLYLLEPLFKEVGQNAIWAVMTVVVVLEFTAGAITTYMRFFPYIRKHYDYGLVIFMLTFNLITVSSYRVEHILKMAQQRVYTIAIGCAICLLMSLLFFPNWSGEDLHHSTVSKFDGLAKSIEDCVKGYFSDGELEIGKTEALDSEDPIGKSYKAVLDSKSIDENLTPQSLRCLFKHPCIRLAGEVSKALRKLGDSIRNCRQCSPEILSDHLHKALQDLHSAIKSQPRLFLGSRSNTSNMLAMAAAAAREQNKLSLSSVKTDTSALMEWKSRKGSSRGREEERKTLRPTLSKIAITSLNFSEALPFAAFASLLVELVARLESVIEDVEELGKIAHFKEFDGCDGVIMINNNDDDAARKKPKKKAIEGLDNPLQNQLPSQAM
ncbi:unnamed protein product [Cuscuta epithymum]|uniref:Aluminum-activated malate transporter n=1 Tax=Cuscuta epithymum TaxID=186058 RepID=A0AAV0CPJ8_9ASTE|nr:unnamed protein product [Cuscuta epithymum]